MAPQSVNRRDAPPPPPPPVRYFSGGLMLARELGELAHGRGDVAGALDDVAVIASNVTHLWSVESPHLYEC